MLPNVPLEVGYTDSETLAVHYGQCGGFARWPYGSTEITAFRRTTDPRQFPFPGDL